ncbi:MAG: hypothetical protein ACRDKV_04530 [Solirubrobacterales bacterium]
MGILDEAIREHLELKRQHGAGDSELQELESEAFGPSARPGETTVAEVPPEDEAATTVQPAESPAEAEEPFPEPGEPGEPPEPEPEAAAEPDTPEAGEVETVRAETEEHPPPEPPEPAEPPAEPGPAAVVEGAEEGSIADQPTELHDVEAELAADAGEPVEDEFFSEQSLSDELDQALDAPDAGPAPAADLPEPEAPESSEAEVPAGDDGGVDEGGEEGEDVLEETPEFLQDSPEHDRLWFEQKPPKDFDFDD